MSEFVFKEAQRQKVKLKLAITGVSGSGKTFSALKIAKGMIGPNGRIGVIDTENRSASLYSDLPGMPKFVTLELSPPFTSERYINAIRAAESAGIDVLIIDSIYHQWKGQGGILDRKEQEQLAKPNANGFTLFSKFTPEHQKFIQSMLQCQMHVIATIRSKQEYGMAKDEKTGKMGVQKLGLAPEQRDGIEYEFTTVFDLNGDHIASASKDRTNLFDGKHFQIGEETGEMLMKWVESGIEPVQDIHAEVKRAFRELAMAPEEQIKFIKSVCPEWNGTGRLTDDQLKLVQQRLVSVK